MKQRVLLAVFFTVAIFLVLADHLTSPSLHGNSYVRSENACAPCGAPCPTK